MADMEDKVKEVLDDVEDTTSEYTQEDMEKNKVMAILSYIIPLIPYFVEKESPWVKYHAKQGMNLLIISIILSVGLSIISAILTWRLWWLTTTVSSLVSLAIFILAIIGIMNVCNGKARELPVINKFKIIK